MDMLEKSDYVLIVPKSTHKTVRVLQQVFWKMISMETVEKNIVLGHFEWEGM